MSQCVDFARKAGYRKLTLWTNSVLDVARHIYEGPGFELVKEEKHNSFGHKAHRQYWELGLRGTGIVWGGASRLLCCSCALSDSPSINEPGLYRHPYIVGNYRH
ncbi:MAG: hypothetical protein NVSMB53_02440 [Gemmatimonadaceae bacterium]